MSPGLADSKIGGLPYWDLSQPYPVDLKGRPLQLLAQISTPITSLTAARKASSKTKERSLAKLSAALAWMTSSSWRGLKRLDFSQVLYNWDCC
mgnify:CR=1 FL=1